MTEPIFFKSEAGLTVGEIAALTGAEPRHGAKLNHRITDIAPFERAGPDHLIFLDKPRYLEGLATTHAGACLTTERLETHVPPHIAVLRIREPYRAFVTVARSLYPGSLRPSSMFEASGIAPGAFVHPAALLESGVTVDPGAVIGPRAEIGAGTLIAAGAVIAPDVRIGRDCAIGAHVSIMHALIGDRVIIHPGCCIGQDGFGYLPGAKHQKVPQLRRVIIQDDVEIGANSTIDRGAVRDTVIGEGSKIDNMVHIAHNVLIGRHCILAGQVGISGSVTIEDYAMLGGQVGVADHVVVGEGAKIAAKSGIVGRVPASARWGGFPAGPHSEWMRMTVLLRQMARREKRGASANNEGEGE